MSVDVFMIEGSRPASDAEHLMSDIRTGAAMDTLSKLSAVEGIGRLVVATNRPELADTARELGAVADLDRPCEEFHFGVRLKELIEKYKPRKLLYLGGASGTLLSKADWQSILNQLDDADGCVLCNNPFSADIIGVDPADVLTSANIGRSDNDIPMILHYDHGVRLERIPDTAVSAFDIDTPVDVAVAVMHPEAGENFKKRAKSLDELISRVNAAARVLAKPYSEIALAGRVSPVTAAELNRLTKCRWRVFSEERGMRSLGRLERNEVVSVLGHLLGACGFREFFGGFEGSSDALFFDTRVLMAHFRRSPTVSDRYLSDMGVTDKISDSWLRKFTEEAMGCRIPVLLGGHSLVNGGIRLIVAQMGDLSK